MERGHPCPPERDSANNLALSSIEIQSGSQTLARFRALCGKDVRAPFQTRFIGVGFFGSLV